MTISRRLNTLFFVSFVLVVVNLHAESAETKSILFVNAGWKGLPHKDLLDAHYISDLKKHGFQLDVCRMTELDRDLLFRYNVVALLWLPPEPHTDAVEAYRSRLPLLREFVEAGGGLYFNYTEAGTAVIYERTYYKVTNELFGPLGLRAIPEVIRDPANSIRHQGGMREYFIRTRNLLRDPITRGVDQVLLPTHWWDQNSFVVDDNWSVLVRAEKSAYSTTEVDAHAVADHVKGSISNAPPVYAVRNVGKGRVAFDTICPVFTISDGNHVMNGGFVLRDGSVFRLHAQTFEWLAQPSLGREPPGGFEGPSYTPKPPPKIDYTDVKLIPITSPPSGPEFVPNLRSYFGLYGIHSDLTDGIAPVSAYCDRARKLGYSYLVFTEPLELMNREKYDRLVELCEAESSDDFLALPGAEYSSDRLWGPRVEQPATDFGPALPGRGHGRPRFLITYLNKWTLENWGENLARDDAILENYPLSPDGNYVVDNGIIYVSSGTPRQCLVSPKRAGVGPWHIVLYNGFATHSYDGRTLIDDSLDWFVDRIGNDYRVTPMTYHRIVRPTDIPPIGETFVSATRASSLDDLGAKVRGLIYPWRNQNYVTNGPLIELYGVKRPGRPRDYLVQRENQWKCFFKVSAEAGLDEVRVMDGTRVFRRFRLNGEKTFSGVVTGYHDKQHYITLHVRDRKRGLAVSGPQVIHGWRHFRGMSGADLISHNDSTFQVGTNGLLDFAWCTGGVLAGGTQIGPRLNVHHDEITPIARDAHSPRVGGRTGVMIEAKEGSEWSLNRLHFHFASEECTVLDQVHEHHSEPSVTPTPNTLARGLVRWFSFTPRLYDWNFLLVDTEVEIMQDITLNAEKEKISPKLCTLAYRPDEIGAMDHYAIREEGGEVVRREWNPDGSMSERSPFRNLDLSAGDYVGLYPGSTASLVVYSLDGNAEASLVDGRLSFGIGKGGESFKKGRRFRFRYLVGLKFRMKGPDSFEKIRRLYGLDGKDPSYSVDLENGEVNDTVYALQLQSKEWHVKGRITASPEMPTDLPLILHGVNDRWNVSLYDFDRGTIKRAGTREGAAYSAVDINIGDRNIFFGHAFVCGDRRVFLELLRIDGQGAGDEKSAIVEVHNPTHEDLSLVLESPLFGSATPVEISAGTTKEVTIPLARWKSKSVTIFTNELTDQLKRRTTNFNSRG